MHSVPLLVSWSDSVTLMATMLLPTALQSPPPVALRTLVSVGVVILLVFPPAVAHAHGGGSQEYTRTVDPYDVRTFQNTVDVLTSIRRDAQTIKHVEYSLWLSESETGAPIDNATVLVTATSAQSSFDSMVAVPIGNLYGVSFPTAGSANWIVNVVIDGPLGSQSFRQALDLGQRAELNVEWVVLGVMSILFAGRALLRHRPSAVRHEE